MGTQRRAPGIRSSDHDIIAGFGLSVQGPSSHQGELVPEGGLEGEGQMVGNTEAQLYIYMYIHRCFPGGTVVKNLPANAREARGVGLIPELGRSPG